MTNLKILSDDIEKQTNNVKEEKYKLYKLQQSARDKGAYWLIKQEFDFFPLKCDICWSGINQNIKKCEPCPSYNIRKKLSEKDIKKMNEGFIFASR